MAGYSDFLAMISGKKPFWLYRLERAGTQYFYTSRGTDYTETGHDWFDEFDVFEPADFFTRTWASTPMKRSAIRQTSAIGRAEVTLTFPQSDTFARTFLDAPQYETTLLTVYHGFANDPYGELSTKFRGRITGVKPAYTTIRLTAENRFTLGRAKGLHRVMQRPCPWAVYHTGCGVTLASFQDAGTLTAISGKVVTVTQASSQADGYYSGGILEWNGKKQMIMAHSGTSLTLIAPVAGMATALAAASPSQLSVTIAPGCNRTTAICSSRFNNLANFGGFPLMTENPFDGRTLF